MPIVFRAGLAAVIAVLCGSLVAAELQQKMAVFDFELINTSLEAERPDEAARLAMLSGRLRDHLNALHRFQLVDTAPVGERLAQAPELRNCNGCDVDFGRELGADIVVTGTVQKVSNLILNINLVVKDVSSGSTLSGGSIDIRGNTDESWQRGLDRLLRNQGLLPASGGGASSPTKH
jgi:hypothetical protein